MKRCVALALTLTLIATAAIGCGDEQEDSNPSEPEALLEKVPPDPGGLAYSDLSELRRQLGLPPDADVDEHPALGTAASNALRYFLRPPNQPAPDVKRAIDHGGITEVAGNFVYGFPGIAVLRTSQPFDEIEAELQRRGWSEGDQGFLEPEGSEGGLGSTADYSVVADAGDGIVVLGYDADTVHESVNGRPGADEEAVRLIGEVNGAVRLIWPGLGAPCVRAVTIGSDAEPPEGEIAITVDGDASADRLLFPWPEARRDFNHGKPEVEGSTITITSRPKATTPRELAALQGLNAGSVEPGAGELYEC